MRSLAMPVGCGVVLALAAGCHEVRGPEGATADQHVATGLTVRDFERSYTSRDTNVAALASFLERRVGGDIRVNEPFGDITIRPVVTGEAVVTDTVSSRLGSVRTLPAGTAPQILLDVLSVRLSSEYAALKMLVDPILMANGSPPLVGVTLPAIPFDVLSVLYDELGLDLAASRPGMSTRITASWQPGTR